MSEIQNVVIIGGGPAGLAAALYTSRANLKPVVFAGSPPGGQLTLTSEVENWLGFESILGPELISKMRSHVEKFGVKIFDENVTSIDFAKAPFKVKSIDREVSAKSVIIATGAKALWLNLESEQRLKGKGVSACATCDGFFFKNKVVAVVGGGDTAMEEALTLTKFATKVYLIHRKDSFRASKIMQERVLKHEKIEVIWNTQVVEVLGESRVEGLKLQSVESKELKNLTVDGLFLGIGHKPDTELFKDKIELDEKGYIVTFDMLAREHLMYGKVPAEKVKKIQESAGHSPTSTNVLGVFAAGDCVDHVYRQATTAVGMGVAAALDVERWLELE
ncbi:MAG: thioredoxin-disulfide reductase [Microgenomates group bacterium]|jgi:thioredoxin reductase (NADPH)|nr:MAG: thioredoxin-disulfide reductase [Candidatus Roizmanbacteria bacterium]